MRRIGWQTRNKPLLIGKKILLPLYSDGFDFSLIAITEDEGSSWTFSEPIVGAGPVQPSLALSGDSSIVAYMRDNGPPPKRLMKSVSTDLGITWSVVEDSDIPNPGSAADVVVLKSGNWALVHNDTEEGRHRLSVWLSPDEGKTWPFRKSIVEGAAGSDLRAHYPAITESRDGIIHVSYTNQIPGPEGQPSVKNIAQAMFSENWLMR
jgi:predicted neuraminidase